MPDSCGVSYIGPTGIEWVCVKPVHDTAYVRRSRDQRGSHVAYSTGSHPERRMGVQAPSSDRHYFVNRWPNREDEGESNGLQER